MNTCSLYTLETVDCERPQIQGKLCCIVLTANTYLYVPPRRYVFSGAEAYGRLTEEYDDDDDDDGTDSSVVSADNADKLTDSECVNAGADADANCPGNVSYPQTPPDLSTLDSSNGSLDP